MVFSKKKNNKKSNKKSKKSTRQLLNTKTISDYGISLYSGEEMIYFIVQPQNLSVMSKENIASKVFALTNVLKGIAEIEMICLNSRDNFEENKMFLKERIEKEEEPRIRRLLEQDLYHLDKIQVQTATARLFLLVLRVKPNDQFDIMQLIHTVEKQLKQQNLNVSRAEKEELKNMLGVYFEQNVTTDKFEDVDGERWYQDETV